MKFFFIFIIISITNLSWAKLVDLRPQMTKAKYQGQRNTCSAFAATGLMEFLIKQDTGLDIDLSESYAYWATKEYALTNNTLREFHLNIDGHPGFLAVEAYRHGSMLESEWPYENENWYNSGDPRCNPHDISPECFAGTLPLYSVRLDYELEPVYIDLDKISDFILEEKRPVVVNVFWYFKAIDQNGDFHMPTLAERQAGGGGHVILLVGYDSNSQRYIYKNSHGEQFGRKGFGTLPRSYLEEYYEVKEHLGQIQNYGPEIQEYLINASKGVSGYLVK